MRRTLTLISIFALLMGILALPAGGSTLPNSLPWDGQGSDSLRCDKLGESPERTADGWIHWIVTQASGITVAELELDGSGSGTYEPTKYGPVVEFFTPYFDLFDEDNELILQATLHYEGTLGDNTQFVISDYCPGVARGEITITKTAVPSFTREHFWDIDKGVETEEGYEHEELPKVWLYTDGTGDETATWTVDVTYEGFDDTGHALSGSVVIENTGDLDANITNLVDTYGGAPVIFDCTVDDEPFIFGQTLLEPEEVLICTYEVDPANKELLENTVRVGGTFSDGTTFNETDTAYYDWDTPTTEINKTVTIKDISDLFDEMVLGSVTAPNGDQFTYTKDFAWEDYGQELCGSYQYDNTASIVETEQSADATLKVNVQCFVGETAWAANAGEPGVFRYTPRGNWATYIQIDGLPKDGTIFAGQTIPVGTYRVYGMEGVEDTNFLDITLSAPWTLEDVDESVKIQGYDEAPSGNPAPGGFTTYKGSELTGIEIGSFEYYGIHLDVEQPDPNFGP